MAFPSLKPSWFNRYEMIGDTIPMSLPAGPGGGANRVYVDFGDTPTYPINTKMSGFQEPATSGAQNRPIWALAESVAWLYEREVAVPFVLAGATGGAPVSQLTLTSQVIYLGEQGATTGNLNLVTDILDGNFNEVEDGSTPPVKVVATDMEVQNPLTLAWHSCYPGGGLQDDANNAVIATTAAPDNYSLTTVGPLVSSALGVSVMNYDAWLRAVRDGTPTSDAFATIIDWTSNQIFKVHRDVVALGWGVDDTIFITHFVFEPRMQLTPAIPDPLNYNIVTGTHTALGLLETDAFTSLKIRTAEAVPYDVEAFILAGLDGAYDQLGFGVPGGGRVINVDAGAVQGSIAVDGGTGFVTTPEPTGTFTGIVGFMAGSFDPSNYDDQAGFVAVASFALNDATIWTPGDSCTAAGAVVTITDPGPPISQFRDALGNTNLIPRVDLMMLLDAGGNFVTNPGSPDGLYIIGPGGGQFTANVTCMDGTAPADITSAVTCRLVRPTFAGWSGRLGATTHKTTLFTSVGSTSLEPCVELNGYYDHGGATGGDFVTKYVGNYSRGTAIGRETFRSFGAIDFAPLRYLGIIGTTYNNDQVWSETIEKSGAAESRLMYQWEEATLGGAHFHMQAEESGAPLDAYARFEIHPLAVGQGVYNGSDYGIAAFYMGQAPGDSGLLQTSIWDAVDGGDRVTSFLAMVEATPARLTWAALVEAPDNSGATVKKEPAVTTVNNPNVDRFEIEELTNFGFSAYQTLGKKISLSLGTPAPDITVLPLTNWQSVVVPALGLGTAPIWNNNHPGGAQGDYVNFPVQVPHGAVIRRILCTYLNLSGPPLASSATLDVFALDSLGAAIFSLAAAPLSMNPAAGVPTLYSLVCTAVPPVTPHNPVNLELFEYFIQVQVGDAAGACQQIILDVRVEFDWIDVMPE
jgi:hypothetical protein